MRICLATNNAHKIQEVHGVLGDRFPLLSLKDIGCHEELPEEQRTISGNSLQKASYVFEHYALSALADDSGLEVDALQGAPGVDSAYYGGPQRNHDDNMNFLLKNLAGKDNRHACFKTVLTLVLSVSEVHQFEGLLPGTILHDKRGNNGFGYDPLFLPDGYTRTLAEMDLEEKNKISHRARALQKLIAFLQKENPV